MPPHQGECVAAAAIGDGHAGVRRRADGGRHAGHDFEGNPVFVQKERFLSAVVEDERVAPLQARHLLALADFLDEQVGDRVAVGALGRGAPDVDPFGPGPGVPQHGRVHQAVVDHHVRAPQAGGAAQRQKAGITRSGADEVDRGTIWHGTPASGARKRAKHIRGPAAG